MKVTDLDFPAALENAAKNWVGTPFRRLHASKGVGVDCANLCYAALVEAGIKMPDIDAPSFGVTVDTPFSTVITDLIETLVDQSVFIKLDYKNEIIQCGDLIIYQISRRMQHIALAISESTQLHVWPSRSAAIVSYDARWKKKITSLYRIKE